MVNNKILLTSVLKPIDDTRMYEKIGLTLTKIDNAQVHIAGFASQNEIKDPNIEFNALFNFPRLSLKRIIAGRKVWKLMIKVKPELVICNTHELLTVTVLYKILFGGRIVYDVQENYFRNLWYGNQFPVLVRHLLALFVRRKERLLATFFDGFILAEQCYTREMPFMLSKSLVVENKVIKDPDFSAQSRKKVEEGPLKLIYTGTIGLTFGIFEAIKMAKELLDIIEGTFTIIGHCPDKGLLERIKKSISGDERINLIVETYPIPHDLILEKIAGSDLGIMSYQPNKALSQRIPTRIYEYMACRLPFIFPANPLWEAVTSPYRAAIAVDFNSYEAEKLVNTFYSEDFYVREPGEEIFFDEDSKKLKSFIENIIS